MASADNAHVCGLKVRMGFQQRWARSSPFGDPEDQDQFIQKM